MNQLLSITKNLEHVHKIIGWDSSELPSIVLIGEIGSGKTSVIESLIGGTIVHHGESYATKCPVIIRLKHGERGGVTFSHKPKENFSDWEMVSREIQVEMGRKGSKRLPISQDAINMELTSRSVIDLTIVDLPGIPISDVPLGGKGLPHDLHRLSERITFNYLRKQDAIIICVIAANTNISEAACLKLAKIVDPTGMRTILVLTKIDLVENSAAIQEKWAECALLGFRHVIGVVCRSPKCIKSKKSINDALVRERKFLNSYCSAVAHRHGMAYLNRVLAEILSDHLNQLLTGTLDAVRTAAFQIQHDFDSLRGESKSRDKIFLEEATRFSNAYSAALNGTIDVLKVQELVGGARISYIIHEIFGKALDSIHPLQGVSRSQILTALKNACGIRPDVLFIPEACFESLARRQITLLASPCRQLVEYVYDEMLRLIKTCSSRLQPGRYPLLYDLIYTVTADLLSKRQAESAALVEELLEMETAYINTLDADFQRDLDVSKTAWFSCKGLQTMPGNKNGQNAQFMLLMTSGDHEGTMNSESANLKCALQSDLKEDPDASLIETLVTSYFIAVRRNLKHTIPKAIMLRMVNYVHEHLYHTLLETLLSQTSGDDVLKKPEALVQKYTELEATLTALKRAETVLQDIKSQLSRGITC